MSVEIIRVPVDTGTDVHEDFTAVIDDLPAPFIGSVVVRTRLHPEDDPDLRISVADRDGTILAESLVDKDAAPVSFLTRLLPMVGIPRQPRDFFPVHPRARDPRTGELSMGLRTEVHMVMDAAGNALTHALAAEGGTWPRPLLTGKDAIAEAAIAAIGGVYRRRFDV